MSNFNPIITDQTHLYGTNFSKHGDCVEGTYNQSDLIQSIRFNNLLSDLGINPSQSLSIHDVGCGICDLYPYILDSYPKLVYSGTDIVPEMKRLSATKYPNVSYFLRDILQASPAEKYDYLVLSGLFNLPGTTPVCDWENFAFSLVDKMYQMCNKAVSFNFLSSKATYYNDQMYYSSPEDMFAYCSKKLTRFIRLNHSYPLYEFTITLFKPEEVQSINNDESLIKYFQ